MKNRISSLDGLRGLAILVVMLNHLPYGYWFSAVPVKFHFILNIIFGNGGTGVYLFFILTGFLMAYLYPAPSNSLAFLSRRFARLFPTFLIMVISLTIIEMSGKISFLKGLSIILIVAIIARIMWEICVKLSQKIPVGKWLTIGWLTLQTVAALGYTFLLLRVPPSIYYEKWDLRVRQIITAIINATLTLPFGQYIPQLDGVYWTLVAEVLFYILYPLLFIPLIFYIKKVSSKSLKILLIASIFPLCYGLYVLGLQILGFEILKIHQIIFFIFGVLIGANIDWLKHSISKFQNIYNNPVILILLIAIILGHLPAFFMIWYQILLVIPVSILLLVIISDNSSIGKLFQMPIFTFLGKYSYSLYLTHPYVMRQIEKIVPADSPLTGIANFIMSFVVSIAVAFVLFKLIEKPYFDMKKSSINTPNEKRFQDNKLIFGNAKKKALILATALLFFLYIAYKPPIALFTYISRHGGAQLFSQQNYTSIKEKSLNKDFYASKNNLGMILTHIKNQEISDAADKAYIPQQLQINLLDKDKNLLSNSNYEVYQIIDSRFHPFGFPKEPNSKGKPYIVQYRLTKESQSKDVRLISDEQDFISVYFTEKSTLIKQPVEAIEWLYYKFAEPFSDKMFWVNLSFIAPFILLLTYSVYFLF